MEILSRQGSFDADIEAAINRNFAALTPSPFGKVWYVDGDNGSDAFPGNSTALAKGTIQGAIAVAGRNDTIYIKTRNVAAGGTDPVNYAETVIIGPSQSGLKLIGVGSGLAQGAQPQIKIGAGSTAMITVRAPGVLIAGLTINMASSTGGGVLLDDDGSTKVAFGTVIKGCVFKNNANATTGQGAICWSSSGGGWQVQIKGCQFFDNGTSINILGTGGSRPKQITIEDCDFFASANSNVDADICFSAGSGVNGLVISRCNFGTVDVPTSFSGAATSRYMDLTNCTNGTITDCYTACIAQGTGAKTFGAGGNAIKVPATVRWANCHGEIGATATTAGWVRS